MNKFYKGDGTQIELNQNTSQTLDNHADFSGKLKNYMGVFPSNLGSENTANPFNDGDYWVFDEDIPRTLNCGVAYKGDIVYVKSTTVGKFVSGVGVVEADGKIFQVISVKQACYTKMREKYDVVIVGAGAGGIGTAYALRDCGYRVALIERLDILGGTHCNTTGLLIACPVGNWWKEICKNGYDNGYVDFKAGEIFKYKEVGTGDTFEKRWRASLFSDEQSVVNNYGRGNHININGAWFSNKYKSDLENSIDIFFSHDVVDVRSANRKIYEIVAHDLVSGEDKVFCADWFVDCSADAVLATKNKELAWGVDYFSGTDGRSRFNESAYSTTEEPDKYAINTLEPCFYIYGNSTGRHMESPSVMKVKEYTDFFPVRANYGWSYPKSNIYVESVSYTMNMNTRDFLEKSIEYNYADGYDRARYYRKPSHVGYSKRFAGIPKMLAIRESFRYLCESVVNQSYLATQITSANISAEKTMALSTWYVDIHHEGNSSVTRNYQVTNRIANGIPYGAMIPKCYSNVLVASRCYGASHIGLSSCRLVKTMLDLGYSAGKAMLDILDNNRINVRDADTDAIQLATGIRDTLAEVEQYFYGSSVSFVEV